jgi:hypothetical protein
MTKDKRGISVHGYLIKKELACAFTAYKVPSIEVYSLKIKLLLRFNPLKEYRA